MKSTEVFRDAKGRLTSGSVQNPWGQNGKNAARLAELIDEAVTPDDWRKIFDQAKADAQDMRHPNVRARAREWLANRKEGLAPQSVNITTSQELIVLPGVDEAGMIDGEEAGELATESGISSDNSPSQNLLSEAVPDHNDGENG